MPKRTTDYRAGLLEDLQDPTEAALYLNAAMDDSDEIFLVALRDVVEAHQISQIAHEADISREHVYRMLSPSGNPRYNNLLRLLRTLGLKLAIATAMENVVPSPPLSPDTNPEGLVVMPPVVVADVPAGDVDTKSGNLILHASENAAPPRKPVAIASLWYREAAATI